MASQDFPSKLLPHDKMAEQAILGAIIIKNEVLYQVADTLVSSDFFSPAHQKIYQAALDLRDRDKPVDEVTLGTFLKDRNLLEQTGGVNYLVELAQTTPVVENVEHYAHIVREKGRLRELIIAANEIAKQGTESPENVEFLIEQATATLHQLESKIDFQKSYDHLSTVLHDYIDLLEKRSQSPQTITGIPTGFTELDELTHGLQKGDLIVLAARPSMGKTAFAMNIGFYASVHGEGNRPVLMFSLEMPKEHIAMRLLCSEGRVDSHKLQTGDLAQTDWDSLSMAAAKIMKAPLLIDDQGSISPMHIRRVIRQAQNEYGEIGLVLVDYLQLMHSAIRLNSREQEIAEISRNLKAIAKEFNVPLLAVSQLNRDLERRTDKHPSMADLRESGTIEQDADIIIFIYRDEVYNEETEDQGIAEIMVAKHRNGETGTKRLAFIGKYTKFANLTLRENV